MADWQEHNEPIEKPSSGRTSDATPAFANQLSARRPAAGFVSRRDWSTVLIDFLGNRSIVELLLSWLWMILVCGAVYWISSAVPGYGLHSGTAPIAANPQGLITSIYFSFVTALSIGYGDVVPVGWLRVLAIAEGAAGLLIFGCVISKFVSRHQEELIEEIHRNTFEERLGRVRINLHLVISDLQAIGSMCSEEGARPERVLTRVESAAAVFAGELQTIHDLLYRPQQVPEEQVLESILANLAAAFRELGELLRCMPVPPQNSGRLQKSLRSIAVLSNQICGDCVPRAYAPHLKIWMDQIRELGSKLA